MSSDTPFFLTKVECPICRTINEFETVRFGAYVEEGRDTDFCPVGITWRHPRYQAYNPLTYFIATCGNCYYSRELTGEFKDWKDDQQFRMYRLRTVKERHLEHLARDGSFVRQMGQAIDMHQFPNESAILKLLLAVFDEELTEHHSTLDMARFYLRVGWVFRSIEAQSDPQHTRLQGMVFDLESKHGHLNSAWQELQRHLGGFEDHIKRHFSEKDVTIRFQDRLVQYREKFNEVMSAVNNAAVQTSVELRVLEQLMREYRSVVAGSDISAARRTFHGFASFSDFLLDLHRVWPGVVTGEREALAKAVHYYKQAFTEGRDIAPGNQQIQACYLIAELSRRTGDYEQAREYFNGTIRRGQEFIYRNRDDHTRTALARKILELAIEQGKLNMAALQTVS
ncbi:MAG: DUF2225 domain-containing protein [Candidatus Zixiibacteriota bacterium]